MQLHRGDRVRYTARFAATVRPYRGIDWCTRRATVASEPHPSRGSGDVGVRWDGTKSVVREPRGALELVDGERE